MSTTTIVVTVARVLFDSLWREPRHGQLQTMGIEDDTSFHPDPTFVSVIMRLFARKLDKIIERRR